MHRIRWLSLALLIFTLLIVACGDVSQPTRPPGADPGDDGGDAAPPPAAGFTLVLNPNELTLTQGDSGTIQLRISPQAGFTGTVTLALVDPPAGVTISPTTVNVSSANRDTTAELTIATTANTPAGRRSLTLRGSSGEVSASATLTLTVNEARVFQVDTFDDTIDIAPGDGTCKDAAGNCSLRAALMEANALGTPAVIELPEGTFTITRPAGTIRAQGGDLVIDSNVTIRGAGQERTIVSGANEYRVFAVFEGRTVVIEDLTIAEGNAGQDENGGGITSRGDLTLRRVTVRDNQATRGGGISAGGVLTLDTVEVKNNRALTWINRDGIGGGILVAGNVNARSVARFTNVAITNNHATVYGGGIYVDMSSLTLENSIVEENEAWVGGGIFISSWDTPSLSLFNSTVSKNRANNGGGIYSAGLLTIHSSTISNNSAKTSGGGLYVSSDDVVSLNNSLDLLNSTISGNEAGRNGGGLLLNAPRFYNLNWRIAFSTITQNSAAERGGGVWIAAANRQPEFKATIIANNTADIEGSECLGALQSRGYNLILSIEGCDFTLDTNDISNRDPLLEALGDYGGPTRTHRPQAASPAVNAIPVSACTDLDGNRVETDQRGTRRPQGANCDIGAVER